MLRVIVHLHPGLGTSLVTTIAKLLNMQSNFAQVQQLLLYPKTPPAAAQKLAEFFDSRSQTNWTELRSSDPTSRK